MQQKIRRAAAILLLLAVATALPAQAASPPTNAHIRMRYQGDDEVTLWIESASLSAHAVALIQLTFPNTWHMTATAGEGARVETRQTDGGLLLLVEGDLHDMISLHITRPNDSAGTLTATPANGEPFLYYYYASADGDMPSPIDALPLEGTTLELPSDGSETDVATATTATAATATEAATEPEAESSPEIGATRYIGCQEAHRTDGSLSVRFLFRATVGATPACAVWIADYSPDAIAPCAVAPAVLSVSSATAVAVPGGTYRAGDGYELILYTYEGLPSCGDILFRVGDGNHLYTVRYQNGIFV